MDEGVVSLNVGGVVYTTTEATLSSDPDSKLGELMRNIRRGCHGGYGPAHLPGEIPLLQDKQGNYLIDRDGKLFRYVLNFLRSSQLILPDNFGEMEQLRTEAWFYNIKALIRRTKPEDILWKSDVTIELQEQLDISRDRHFVAREMTIVASKKYRAVGPLNQYESWNQPSRCSDKMTASVEDDGDEFRAKLKSFGWEKISSTSVSMTQGGTTSGVAIVEKWFTRSLLS